MTEQLIASAGGTSNIPPHPDGQFAAKCIDIIDFGMVDRTWQGKTKRQHRICVRFYCGESFKDGEGQLRPLWVDAFFTLSLDEKSNLRPFLEAWRGKKFTAEELVGFDVLKLLNAPAFLQLSHNATPTKTYCNVDTVMRLPGGMDAPETPEGYVRVKDREGNKDQGEVTLSEPDDDLPFK